MTVTTTSVLRNSAKAVFKVVTTTTTELSDIYQLSGATSVYICGDGANNIEAWLPNVSGAGVLSTSDHGSEEDANYEITSIMVGTAIAGDVNKGTDTEPLMIPKNMMPPHAYFKFGVAGTYYIHINFG